MDRTFLSHPDVVGASREFVCVRLATYESAAEAVFLKSIFLGRSGELENTTFAILAPDGKTRLTGAGRSPKQVFRGAGGDGSAEMAVALRRIAAQYPGTANAARCIPYAEDVRRGLAMASADILPLVVLSAATPEARAQLEAALAPLAWSGEFVGKLAWAPAATAEDLRAIAGAAAGSRVLVIQPDTFGQQGKVLAETAATDAAGLRAVLAAGLAKFVPESKDSMRHVKEGERRGVHWEGEIPVTDPGGRR